MKPKIILALVVAVLLAIIIAAGVDAQTAPEQCSVPGEAWINWWESDRLQVWWECSKTARVERWSCWVQVQSPTWQKYDLIWTDQTPGPFDYTVLDKPFPFWLFLGRWRAIDGRCWADGRVNNQWVELYEQTITHNGYPLAQWPFEQQIGPGPGSPLAPMVFIPMIKR